MVNVSCVKLITGRVLREATVQSMVDDFEKECNIVNVAEQSKQLVCGCGKNKPVIREPAYIHCDWCGSISVEE